MAGKGTAPAANGGWVRPLGPQEKMSDDIYQKDCFVISYVLRFSTSRQLTEQDARTVFTSLYRKVPSLRMCLQEKDGELWFRELEEEKIDFEVIPDADVNKVFHDMSHYRFKAKGPIWAARLLPWAPEQSDYVDSIKLDADNRGKHPHVSHVVIAYHHSITDGFTCHRIMRAIMSLIDNVISCKVIDDTEQFGVFLDREAEKTIFNEMEMTFQKDKQLFEERKKSFKNCMAESLIEKAYPIQAKLKPETVCLPYILDKETSMKFIARCKKEGVTFHSGFSTVLNAAIITLVLDKKIERDTYKISSLHTINQRNYFKGYENSFGCGMGIMDVTLEFPKDIVKNFWLHAKRFHVALKDQQERKNSFEHHLLEKMTGSSPINLLSTEGVDVPLPPLAYYCSSNMLDVTKMFGDVGEHIQLEYYDRLTAGHLFPVVWLGIFNSFKGQLIHSLQYNTHIMGANAAQKLSDTIFKVLADVA